MGARRRGQEPQRLRGGDFDFYNLIRNSDVVASVAVDADMSLL